MPWTAVLTKNGVSLAHASLSCLKTVAANVSVAVGKGCGNVPGAMSTPGRVLGVEAQLELCDFEKATAPFSSSGASICERGVIKTQRC